MANLAALRPEDLLAMSTEEVVDLMRSAGIAVDEAAIDEAADAVFNRAAAAIRSGATELDEATWTMIDRQLENATKDVLRKQVKATVRDARTAAIASNDPGGVRTYVWIATMVNTCNSCLSRHGEVKTLAAWSGLGMPGAPVLICNGNCNCQLLPYSATPGEDVYVGILDALGEPTVEVKLQKGVKAR